MQKETEKGDSLWSRIPGSRRRIILAISGAVLVILVGGSVFAILWQTLFNPGNLFATPPTMQISLDGQALNAIISKSLNTPQNAVSDLNLAPMPGNRLQVRLNLNINTSGIHRMLPIEIDSLLGGTSQQKNLLTVQYVIRGGVDAGPGVVARLQATLNQFLQKPGTSTTPGLVPLSALVGSIRSSNTRVCGYGSVLLHLGLHVRAGIQVVPVNVDSYIGLNQQHTLLFHLESVTYNGGKDATGMAKGLVNQTLNHAPSTLGSASSLKQVKLLSLGTDTQSVCGHSTEMLVLQLGPTPGNN